VERSPRTGSTIRISRSSRSMTACYDTAAILDRLAGP
jgi:hypothetical protein